MRKLDILFIDWGLSNELISNALCEELDFEIFDFPMLLRKEIQSNSMLGSSMASLFDKGEHLNSEVIEDFMTKTITEKSDNIIITGFPRSAKNFSILKQITSNQNILINKIWFFKLRNKETFMNKHFEEPSNKKYLDKYGQEIIDSWLQRFEHNRKYINDIKLTANKLEWTEIEMDYLASLTTKHIKNKIRNFA